MALRRARPSGHAGRYGVPMQGVDERECPAPGCERSLSYNAIACREHWAILPAPMRKRIRAERDMHGLSGRLSMLMTEAFAEWVRGLTDG